MYEIDKIDRKIVELLMEDGRKPAAVIARQIGGITERIVRYRIDRMVEEELITISAIVHPQKIGYSVTADVFLEVEAGFIHNVAEKLAGLDCISYVAFAIGETDVSIQVVAKDASEVYRFVSEVIGIIPGIRKTTTSIVPVVLKDVYQWRIPANDSLSGDGKDNN